AAMIVPDVNLLVYAYNGDAPHHEAARTWWEEVLNGQADVGLAWAVAMGFIRLVTHPRVVARPASPSDAMRVVRSWFAVPAVRPLTPGPRHLDILGELLEASGVAASLTSDAHLAALAIEYQAELHSNDVDFARFSGLKWVNPLEP
ncbi:MAG: type II toxin-antitoxin system VapC family toxin, partial [Spirochaetota bacterium]